MISQVQRGARRIVRDVESVRRWVLEQVRVRQKPELDGKVREIRLKKARKVVLSLGRGVGRSIGRSLGSVRRLGVGIARFFGF